MILNVKEKPTDNWEYSESLVYIAGKIFRQYTIDWREYKGGINGSNVPIEALSRMKSEAYVGNGADEDYQYNIFQQLGMWIWWFLWIDMPKELRTFPQKIRQQVLRILWRKKQQIQDLETAFAFCKPRVRDIVANGGTRAVGAS